MLDPQNDIVDTFEYFENWTEKYQYIIELGQRLPALPEALRVPDYLVKGCQSQVWLHSRLDASYVYFTGASDSAIVQGLMALLFQIFSAQTPMDILKTKLICFQKIGLNKHLSMTRNNGLYAMLKRIQFDANQYASKV